MSVKARCECGAALRAEDDAAGGRATCPSCGRAVCPRCSGTLARDAVLCVKCGYDLRTGATARIAGAEEDAPRRGFAFPLHTVIRVGLVVLVLGAAWLFIGAPIVANLRIGYGLSYMRNGDLHKALAHFEEIRGSVGGSARQSVDLRIRQIKLEIEKNTGATLGDGVPIESGSVAMAVERQKGSGGALLFKVTLQNHGQTPLTLREDHFYLRGLSDVSTVGSHVDNSIEGLVVPPGETKEGIVAFRGLPIVPVQQRVGFITLPVHFLIFNDGANYVKIMLPA